MAGIIALFTHVERLEIINIYAQPRTDMGWDVTVIVRNTGTAVTTIDSIFINGVLAAKLKDNGELKPQNDCILYALVNYEWFKRPTLNPGEEITILFIIGAEQAIRCGATEYRPGISIEVRLHTTGGMEYPKLIVVP